MLTQKVTSKELSTLPTKVSRGYGVPREGCMHSHGTLRLGGALKYTHGG